MIQITPRQYALPTFEADGSALYLSIEGTGVPAETAMVIYGAGEQETDAVLDRVFAPGWKKIGQVEPMPLFNEGSLWYIYTIERDGLKAHLIQSIAASRSAQPVDLVSLAETIAEER